MKGYPYHRGFTLIELLVTLAVAVIISTIAVPGFQTVVASSRLAADHNEIISGLASARSEAVKRREEITFHMAEEENGTWRYRIFADSLAEPLLNRVLEDARFNITEPFYITFDALGRRGECGRDPCQFRIEHGDKATIKIGRAGHIGNVQEDETASGDGV